MHQLLALRIRECRLVLVCAAVLITVATTAAQSPQAGAPSPASPAAAAPSTATTPQKSVLKQSVTLLGANDSNDALSMAVPVGTPLSLILIIKDPPTGHPHGELKIFPFLSQGEQPVVATPRIRLGESNATADASAAITLEKPGQSTFSLEFDRLRPGKTYKGQLFLTSADLVHHWDITLTTEGRGIVAVDPVGTLKFVRSPWSEPHSFSFTLYDKSEGGPYHHVRVRFESSASANSKALTSNFVLNTLSFWENDKRIDLERRDASGSEHNDAGVTLTKARTFAARVGSLSPGEYSGALRFAADEASDDSADAKLPLSIQIRDHWLFPVLVIVIGSILGWFSSKYIIGARKARELSRQVSDLRARADSLARSSTPRIGWEFPSEAGSLSFARLGVELNRLARLTASTMEVVLHGDEIEQLRQRAERRLLGLESLQKTRLRVQPCADGRPAAQLAIGRRLRSSTDLLDQPTFGETEQANLTKLLETVETWVDATTSVAAYRDALIDRLRSDECPKLEDLQSLASGLPIRARLDVLVNTLPTEDKITDQIGPAELKKFDQVIARTILLWRERTRDWAAALAEKDAAGETLDVLFNEVDTNIWETLNTHKEQLALQSGRQKNPQTFEVVEIDLASNIPDLDVWRLRRHPLRLGWRIKPPRGDARTTETDGLTLVQYFPSVGPVQVAANLRWQGKTISIEPPLPIEVDPNPEYGKHWRFATEWTEYAAIGVAALFAIVTAMGTQYDSTFGTFTQYLTMFIWAAGAGTGGNLFSQLGTTAAPGGANATLK